MQALSETEFETVQTAEQHLDAAALSLRVLSSVNWTDVFRTPFLRNRTLPRPRYDPVDTTTARGHVETAVTLLGRGHVPQDHVVVTWLYRLSQTLRRTSQMIDARGTPDFFTHSKALFGEPTQVMIDKTTRVIDMARHMDDTLQGLNFSDLVMRGYETDMSSEAFAAALGPSLERFFGDAAPRLEVSDNLSAKALAGARRIRVRRDARFTPRDVEQLLQHEAFIHTATALNGKAQEHFQILGRSHAGTTETQEGLAVFAEIISGAIDPSRFYRLADRVIAIQMSIDGADFHEVFEFYQDRTGDDDVAYDNTRRIFRGGVMTGGAPFTKDMVYLNGLLRVHNFMRTVVSIGRADLIRILFCGKMDIEDLPALAQLASKDRLSSPRFLPPWVKDLRFLVSYMAYSGFLNQVKLPGFQAYYEAELKDVPEVWDYGV